MLEPSQPPQDLSTRAQTWWHTRDPRVLWPELDPSLLQPSADAIGRTVASRLRGETTMLGSADGRDAYALGIAAMLTGTGPLLGYWVEQGALEVGHELATILARHLAHGRARAERIARGAVPALERLVAAGVTPTIIKGFHTGCRYFPEPGLRPIIDVDIVVTPGEVPQAEAALREADFTPSASIGRPYKRDWFPPDDDGRLWSFEHFDARERWKLELHDGANFGDLPSFGLRSDPGGWPRELWPAHGVPLCTPAQPWLTVILAAHLSAEFHTRCLLRVVELISVIRGDLELRRLDWAALDDALNESGARRFVYPALSLVECLAPGTVDPGILKWTRRASTRIARLVAHRRTPTSPILEDRFLLAERLMWIASGRDAFQAVANWINPQPGRPWRETLGLYHSRLVRLVAARASWAAAGRERR